MLSRILEPEVMDTIDEANDYNSMDHRAVNRLFVDDFLAARVLTTTSSDDVMHIFDAGTGTALIPLELIRRGERVHVTASDLATHMLAVASENVRAARATESIRLVRTDCKELPDADATFDAVMSNSIVHHIPQPRRVLAELWRILKPGGLLFVRDLMRPADTATLNAMVETYAGSENAHQQQMFRDSLHAALTVDEVSGLLEEIGLPANAVRATSDRHWTIVTGKPTAIVPVH